MIFQHARFQIWNQSQHPFKHTLTDFAFSSPALPGVTNVESALNYILAVLYPSTQPNVANVAALPALGNTIGDFRVVDDDGDGNSAGYRWEQREGEAVASWHKVFDVDWSTDAILAAVTDVTQDLYFVKMGRQDLDDTGAIVAGLYAGQKVYGGTQAGQNLTLNSNSGDGVGAQTGFVQIDSPFRPTVDAIFDLSTATERWKDGFFSGTITIDTLDLTAGSIIDSSGAIDFSSNNLTTTGNIEAEDITSNGSFIVDDGVDTLTIDVGSIVDTTGQISFGATNLATTGTIEGATLFAILGGETLTLDANVGGTQSEITSTLGLISFGDEDLITTGDLDVGAIVADLLDVGNIRIDGGTNTISSTDVNGNIILSPNGTGVIQLLKTLDTAFPIVSTSTIDTSSTVDAGNLQIGTNKLISTNANGNIEIDPNGTGIISVFAQVSPDSDASYALGTAALRFTNIFLSGGIGDGTTTIANSTLQAFRNGIWRDAAQTIPAQAGDVLFYDTVSGTWLASTPDSEVDHTTISNLTLGDSGHTQFAMLAGRAGGQTLQGGTAASQHLILESTAHATKGFVKVSDDLVPVVNASYSGSWSGTDIGDATLYFRDVYSKGEFRGFRLENYTFATLPASSGQNVGRVVYATDTAKAYIDTGSTMKVLGVSKFDSDTVWNGTDIQKDVTVSGDIVDARHAVWQLMDNANDFEIMNVTLKAMNATTVRIDVAVPLDAGSYRLIGLE